jgi:hypothetical protein
MKAKELIEILRGLDPETEVFHLNYDHENGDDLMPIDARVRTVVHEEWHWKTPPNSEPQVIFSVDTPSRCPWPNVEQKIVSQTPALVITAGKGPR